MTQSSSQLLPTTTVIHEISQARKNKFKPPVNGFHVNVPPVHSKRYGSHRQDTKLALGFVMPRVGAKQALDVLSDRQGVEVSPGL